jgi:hypothetical protein
MTRIPTAAWRLPPLGDTESRSISRLGASRRFISRPGASRRFSGGAGRVRLEPAAGAARLMRGGDSSHDGHAYS